MKKIFFLAIFAGASLISLRSNAQELTKGNLAFLKDVSEMKVSFVYDKLRVGELGKEENYVKKKKTEKMRKRRGKAMSGRKTGMVTGKNGIIPNLSSCSLNTPALNSIRTLLPNM